MKKINAILVTSCIDFINSINFVLKDFGEIIICGIFPSMEDAMNQERSNDFHFAIWDVDEEGFSIEEIYKFVNKDIRTIVVSSDPKNAIEAFNIDAVDFISKSDIADRLPKSLNKVTYLIDVNEKINNLSITTEESHEPIKIIAVSSLNDINIIPVDSITYLESQGRYTLIYTLDGESVVSSKNLGVYEKLLSRNNFFRIHHSYIVNIDVSVKIQKKDGVYLEIINNKYLPISKRRVEGFYRCLGIIS
jgi:two-component system LytT family response regulator